jgi:hypothetical protein
VTMIADIAAAPTMGKIQYRRCMRVPPGRENRPKPNRVGWDYGI